MQVRAYGGKSSVRTLFQMQTRYILTAIMVEAIVADFDFGNINYSNWRI